MADARQNNAIVNSVTPAKLPSVETTEDRMERTTPNTSLAESANAETGAQGNVASSKDSETTLAASTARRQTRSASGASAISEVGRMKPPAEVPIPRAPVAADTRFQLPLAFQPVNSEALTPAIQNKLTQLQEQFVQAIGDTRNPADPAFQNRWMTAQIEADMQYRALFGWSAFEEMEIQRAQSAATAAQ